MSISQVFCYRILQTPFLLGLVSHFMSVKERLSVPLGMPKGPDAPSPNPLGAGSGHASQDGKLVMPAQNTES